MNHFLLCSSFIFIVLLFSACSSNTSNQDDATAQQPNRPARNTLSATEFIQLTDCDNLPCVQLVMKDFNSDFFHAYPGEFGNFNRLLVIDTLGDTLDIPMSTLYVSVDPDADWRMAHTVHHQALSDQLLQQFADQQFVLSDSVYRKKNKGYTYHYRSEQYPGLVLHHFKTFEPWYKKGLYNRPVTWPCYVFELIATE